MVDTLSRLLFLRVTAAKKQDCAQMDTLSEILLEITGENIEFAYFYQGHTGRKRGACGAEALRTDGSGDLAA